MLFSLPSSLVLIFLQSTLASTWSPSSPLSALLWPRDADQQASADYTKDDLFETTILNVTNTYRKQHNATSLKWNDSLAETAAKWSDRCKFEHSGGPTGENLSSGYANASASIIVWGQEREAYDFAKGDFTDETGHFTQLVWKATQTVGCGRTQCDGKDGDDAPGWFVVCEYYPPGNVLGNFTQNVQEEVPEDEQPDGPSDPQVPSGGGKKCPQGGDCSAGVRAGGSVGALWVAVLMACAVSWFGL